MTTQHQRARAGRAVQRPAAPAHRLAHQAALALTNAALCERLRRESIIDPLTGLFNRRHMTDILQKEIRRASRKEQSMSIVMLDIDHFKQLNDDHGHPGGDEVLRELGALIRNRVRAYDIPCRIGGGELLILLPACDVAAAVRVAEDLRAEIARTQVSSFGFTIAAPTASFGVATYPAHGDTPEALMAAADAALYRAKASGRNRICAGALAS